MGLCVYLRVYRMWNNAEVDLFTLNSRGGQATPLVTAEFYSAYRIYT